VEPTERPPVPEVLPEWATERPPVPEVLPDIWPEVLPETGGSWSGE
jgi:hypothetical protein